jgi:DNA-directed RNA polymerase specialized sigma24 family protein
MATDIELLRRYAEFKDEDAFAELVERHVSFVYSAALRQLGEATHRAQDITQTVFIQLARHAARVIRSDEILGWLHTATHHAAANLKRSESRRQLRELEAHMMQSDSPWAN